MLHAVIFGSHCGRDNARYRGVCRAFRDIRQALILGKEEPECEERHLRSRLDGNDWRDKLSRKKMEGRRGEDQ